MTGPQKRLEKQESLPFPPTPMAGKVSLSMQESVYQPRVTPRRLGDDAPNILIVLDGRRGSGPAVDVRRRDQHPDPRSHPRRGDRLQPVSHDGPVLADTGVAADRAQSSQGVHRGDHRVRERLGCVLRAHPQEQRAGGGGAEGLRLRHGWLGQVAQHAGHRGRPDRPVRVLADELGVRVLLRVPCRGVVAVRTEPGAQHDVRVAAQDPGRGLPPERGPGRRRHRLAAQAQGDGPGPAVLHVLGQRRHPRPPPRAQGVHRQVPGQVRRRLGRLPGAGVRAGQGQGLDPSPTRN